jgi:hypothetical protein
LLLQVLWLCETKLVNAFNDLDHNRAQALGQFLGVNVILRRLLWQIGDDIPCVPVILTTFQHEQAIVFCQGTDNVTAADESVLLPVAEHAFTDVYAALHFLQKTATNRLQHFQRRQLTRSSEGQYTGKTHDGTGGDPEGSGLDIVMLPAAAESADDPSLGCFPGPSWQKYDAEFRDSSVTADAAMVARFDSADADYSDAMRQMFPLSEQEFSLIDQLPFMEALLRKLTDGRIGLPPVLAAYMQ